MALAVIRILVQDGLTGLFYAKTVSIPKMQSRE